MALKLIDAGQSRWHAMNAPHPVALVRADARFKNSNLIERLDDKTTQEAASKILIRRY